MFCPNCGKSLADGEICACQQTPRMQPVPQKSQDATPALAVLRKTMSSGMFLALVILYSVMLLGSIIYAVMPMNMTDMAYMTEQLEDAFYEYEALYEIDMSGAIEALNSLDEMEDVFQSVHIISMIFSFLGMIPTVLIGIGLWKLYVTAKAQNGEAMRAGGLSFIRIGLLIEMIALCAIYGLLVIAFLVAMIIMPSLADQIFIGFYSYEVETFVAMIEMILAIFLIVFIAVLAVTVLYSLKALKTVKTIKSTMITGQPNEKVSMFLIVMMFIGAASCLIAGLSSVFVAPVTGLTTLCTAAFYCIAAITLCMYRNQMKLLRYAPIPPNWQQPVQPQPMQQMYQQPQQTWQQPQQTWQQQSQQPWQQQPQQPWQQPQQSYTITYTTCENCGQQYPSGSATCPKCGTANENKS